MAARKWFDALEERGYLDPFTAATAPMCARRSSFTTKDWTALKD
jgi:hypothetical protein